MVFLDIIDFIVFDLDGMFVDFCFDLVDVVNYVM